MNINPFISLISTIISLYSFALLVWLILTWLIRFDIVNRYQKLVRSLMNIGDNLFEPVFYQIRRIIPPFGGMDFSPIILILLLNFVKELLFTYFYKF
jgi:YggT family protein